MASIFIKDTEFRETLIQNKKFKHLSFVTDEQSSHYAIHSIENELFTLNNLISSTQQKYSQKDLFNYLEQLDSIFKNKKTNSDINNKINNKLITINKKFLTTQQKIYSTNNLQVPMFISELNHSLNLDTFGQILLSSNLFKQFSAFYLLHLEKGQSLALSREFRIKRPLKRHHIPAYIFQEYFLEIKKSKNIFFTYTKKVGSDLKIIGNYIAQVVQNSNEQFILILSNEDLFPPHKETVSSFELFIKDIQEVLFNLSTRVRLNRNIHFFQEAIEFLENNKAISSYHKRNIGDVFHLQRIELIGELFNTVKHELNNPLCGVELYLNILDEVVQNDQKFFVNQMNASITRAKNVINTFNNIYSNTTVYSKVKLETILDHALTICKSELKFVYLEKDFKNLESMVINTNENYIIHILFNLLTNAVHAVKENDHEKKITLNLNNAEDGIIIYISDNGQGIPVEIQKTIFNPFFTTKKTGTGLGLAISHYLASQINGNLKLEHSSREGTCFSLYIKDLNDE